MRLSVSIAAVVLSAARLVLCDDCEGNYATFSDPGIDLDVSLALPNVSTPPFPMLLTFSAPLSVGWAGFATGGCMLRSPLVVAWRNGSDVVATTRWAAYVIFFILKPFVFFFSFLFFLLSFFLLILSLQLSDQQSLCVLTTVNPAPSTRQFPT